LGRRGDYSPHSLLESLRASVGQAAQSRAIRGVVRAAVAAGITDPDILDGIVANVVAAGDPRLHQLTLFA
jgi:hypothetical protein